MNNAIDEIDREITALEQELSQVKGTDTEVYTRIVGYHRAVSNWNKGKREEYNHRVCFDVDKCLNNEKVNRQSGNIVMQDAKETSFVKYGNIDKYLFFYSQYCRNCQPVKESMGDLMMNGENIDVSSELGLNVAKQYGVTATPTVIMLDDNGNVVAKLFSKEEVVAFSQKIEAVAIA